MPWGLNDIMFRKLPAQAWPHRKFSVNSGSLAQPAARFFRCTRHSVRSGIPLPQPEPALWARLRLPGRSRFSLLLQDGGGRRRWGGIRASRVKVAASGAPTRPAWAPSPRRAAAPPRLHPPLGPATPPLGRFRPGAAYPRGRAGDWSSGRSPPPGRGWSGPPKEGGRELFKWGRRESCGAGRGRAAAPGACGHGPPLPLPGPSPPSGAPGGRRGRGDRVGAAVRLGTRGAGSPGCQGERATGPVRREGRALGWLERMRGAFFFSSFTELCWTSCCCKTAGRIPLVCVRTARAVVLGALCINNPVLCVLFAGDPVGTCLRSAISVQARFPPQLLLVDLLYIMHQRSTISPLSLTVKQVADYIPL